MQRLKIKVKEVKEERRELTLEEQAVYSVSESSIYVDAFRNATKERLNEIGLVNVESSGGITNIGTFRTETIRDATPAEERAYIALKLFDVCKVELSEDSMIKLCGKHNQFELRHTMDIEWILDQIKDKYIYPEVVEE